MVFVLKIQMQKGRRLRNDDFFPQTHYSLITCKMQVKGITTRNLAHELRNQLRRS